MMPGDEFFKHSVASSLHIEQHAQSRKPATQQLITMPGDEFFKHSVASSLHIEQQAQSRKPATQLATVYLHHSLF